MKQLNRQLASLVKLSRLDSAALLLLNEPKIYLFGQIQSHQTGGQPYGIS